MLLRLRRRSSVDLMIILLRKKILGPMWVETAQFILIAISAQIQHSLFVTTEIPGPTYREIHQYQLFYLNL